MLARVSLVALLALGAVVPSVRAQETLDEDTALRTAVLAKLPKTAARRVFGDATTAAPGDVSVIGEYWKGCYSGGVQLAAAGPTWQVMRTYRNRNWGTPQLVGFLKKFSAKAAAATGWPGILVGDMSQPRGGPMLTGHSSHQLGIEADIWLRPMPNRRLQSDEIAFLKSTDLLRKDRRDVDPSVYTRAHFELLKAAASEPSVARVFVNAAIKKALCRDAGSDRAWLSKIRPAIGHSYHFHIRLACPKDEPGCIDQAPPAPGDGCGKEVDSWLRHPVEPVSGGLGKMMAISSMPTACRDLAVREPILEASAGGEGTDALAAADAPRAREGQLRDAPVAPTRAPAPSRSRVE